MQLAVDVVAALRRAVGVEGDDTTIIDLATSASTVFDQSDPTMVGFAQVVDACDVVVFASPTYKATYTGLLKAFLDRFPSDGLRGLVAVPLMVGGAPNHALAPDVYLRPLLVELGALVPSASLFVLDSQLDSTGEQIDEWCGRAAGPIAACARTLQVGD